MGSSNGERLYAHLHYFSKETALRTLEDAGYEVLDYFYTPRSVELWFGARPAASETPRKLLSTIHKDLAAGCWVASAFWFLLDESGIPAVPLAGVGKKPAVSRMGQMNSGRETARPNSPFAVDRFSTQHPTLTDNGRPKQIAASSM